jgi:hypothetical protein
MDDPYETNFQSNGEFRKIHIRYSVMDIRYICKLSILVNFYE